jgi:hypothetical protein
MNLPQRIFFTGAPGSGWSSICQTLEELPEVNTSDRHPEKEYNHRAYQGHRGSYFGLPERNMEWQTILDANYIDSAWSQPGLTQIVKCHDWVYMLDEIREKFPNDWIMMVYRPDHDCYAWWYEVGGFSITYPNYSSYKSNAVMMSSIMEQNSKMLEYVYKNNLTWHPYTKDWVKENFGVEVQGSFDRYTHNLVCLVK